jgi:hypothetical protein
MRCGRIRVDPALVIPTTVRSLEESRRFGRPGMEAGGRGGAVVALRPEDTEPPEMTDSRTKHMLSIRERIERREYDVDAIAVAESILLRLLAGRGMPAR